MKITVIGPGAMGLLYGAKLSAVCDTAVIGNNKANIDAINANGVTIKRNGSEARFSPKAYLNGAYPDKADLVIMFTKGYLTEAALAENKNILTDDTYIMTLQNGAGHENILQKFADKKHILIGTTQQGSSRENAYTIVNSGLGDTVFGSLLPDFDKSEEICKIFEKSGFPCSYSDDIYKMIWNKLMINASSSVLSGILQVNQGFVAQDKNAWERCQILIREICDTANAQGYDFDKDEQCERIYKHLLAAPDGYTSIYSDLKNGRKTEVDAISGAVVSAAQKAGIAVPEQEKAVKEVHDMETRNKERGICR